MANVYDNKLLTLHGGGQGFEFPLGSTYKIKRFCRLNATHTERLVTSLAI